MGGITDLNLLLTQMQPVWNPGTYVFVSIASPAASDIEASIMLFRESEACTLILTQTWADSQRLPYEFPCAWITLKVHSALESVGLTAAFSGALARAGISCNVVAGYYHDHIFIPLHQAENAMQVLRELTRASVHPNAATD